MKLKIGKKEYTFVLISDANSAVKRFRISEFSLWLIPLLLVTLMLVSSALYYIGLKNKQLSDMLQSQMKKEMSTQQEQLSHTLSQKNQTIEQLQSQIYDLSQQAQDIKSKVSQIEKLESEVKSLTNLNPTSMKTSAVKSNSINPVKILSVGGPEIPVTNAEMSQLADQTKNDFSSLETEMADLMTNLTQSKNQISAAQHLWEITPNIWPIDARDITSPYGIRRDPFTNQISYHDGVDIGAKRGTPIYATADGKVEFAGYKGARGNNVVINHSDGLETEYMHMSKILVQSGEEVKKGQTIGLVGSTGRSTGPHLHYGVIKNGVIVNPMTYLPKHQQGEIYYVQGQANH